MRTRSATRLESRYGPLDSCHKIIRVETEKERDACRSFFLHERAIFGHE